MKIEGKISILIGRDETTIEIHDDQANVKFVSVKLTPEQLCAALSRQVRIECELELRGLDKVGKIHENKSFVFEIPGALCSSKHSEELQKIAQSQLEEGWVAEKYFDSQDSFFKREDKQYAKVTIRRWNERETIETE